MRTADVVRHIQIVRAALTRYPEPVAVDGLAILEAWVLEGARLSDVVGVDPRVKLWIESRPERPVELG